MNRLTRRQFVGTAIGACALSHASGSAPGFTHRGYLGWITDLATAPDPNAVWPSMRIDAPLIADYERTFDRMSRLGFNEMTLWGMYVSQAWPEDIKSAVSGERGAKVERILALAHKRGIRVYAGLGVYSWGFEQIIKMHPELSRGNPRAMCPDVPESWVWMQRVADFVLTRFPVDGVSMQSADQGRCKCSGCDELPDAEYHGRLNLKVADYIRSKYRGKTVAVNCWGMNLADARNEEPIVRLSSHVDYIIDVNDTAASQSPAQRQNLIRRAGCAWGTIGGPQVEPPQHWNRDRWFLPTVRKQSEHLQQLFKDGGRACEYFFHILANPGCELSFYMAGKVLSAPAAPWRTHLSECIEELYGVQGSFAGRVENLMLDAEDAFFSAAAVQSSETISMEPLVSDRSGPPVYLKRLPAAARPGFMKKMEALRAQADKLSGEAKPNVPAKSRLAAIERAIRAEIADVAFIQT